MKIMGDSQMGVLLNPFEKKCITNMFIHGSEWADGWRWSGTIAFQNGNTSGEQKFKIRGLDITPLIQEMNEFIKTL